jgi:hypothetical protein
MVKMPVCEYYIGRKKLMLVKKGDYPAAFLAGVNHRARIESGRLSVFGHIVQRVYPAVGSKVSDYYMVDLFFLHGGIIN